MESPSNECCVGPEKGRFYAECGDRAVVLGGSWPGALPVGDCSTGRVATKKKTRRARWSSASKQPCQR
jgi:hypothetical protein